jgi:DNA-3-methyladenine glycosylase II
MAQQISTAVACRLAGRVKAAYPLVTTGFLAEIPDWQDLRTIGLPSRRAQCCIAVLENAAEIRLAVNRGTSWEDALSRIKGIGPWTLAVFRIMVLREPDELPSKDLGLTKAIHKAYGSSSNLDVLAERWRPYRSVACWYLWRTLGNEQLG